MKIYHRAGIVQAAGRQSKRKKVFSSESPGDQRRRERGRVGRLHFRRKRICVGGFHFRRERGRVGRQHFRRERICVDRALFPSRRRSGGRRRSKNLRRQRRRQLGRGRRQRGSDSGFGQGDRDAGLHRGNGLCHLLFRNLRRRRLRNGTRSRRSNRSRRDCRNCRNNRNRWLRRRQPGGKPASDSGDRGRRAGQAASRRGSGLRKFGRSRPFRPRRRRRRNRFVVLRRGPVKESQEQQREQPENDSGGDRQGKALAAKGFRAPESERQEGQNQRQRPRFRKPDERHPGDAEQKRGNSHHSHVSRPAGFRSGRVSYKIARFRSLFHREGEISQGLFAINAQSRL